jgi:hypothetical protein
VIIFFLAVHADEKNELRLRIKPKPRRAIYHQKAAVDLTKFNWWLPEQRRSELSPKGLWKWRVNALKTEEFDA